MSHPIGWEFISGALLAAAVVAFVVLRARGSLRTNLPSGATFSFTDSWATNLTALIAAIAAVAGVIADKLPDIVDQQSILEFAIGTGMLALVATFAPIAYAAFAGFGAGTGTNTAEIQVDRTAGYPSQGVAGLLLASFLTLTGAFGSLAAILVVVVNAHLSAWTATPIWTACVLGIALVALYAVQTLVTLLRTASSPNGDLVSLTGIVVVSCCGSQASRERIALL